MPTLTSDGTVAKTDEHDAVSIQFKANSACWRIAIGDLQAAGEVATARPVLSPTPIPRALLDAARPTPCVTLA